MSAEEKPIEVRKSVSWDWTAFWKEHQLLLNSIFSKYLPEIQTEYELFHSGNLQDGYIIYDGKKKSVHVRHGLKKSILAFVKSTVFLPKAIGRCKNKVFSKEKG